MSRRKSDPRQLDLVVWIDEQRSKIHSESDSAELTRNEILGALGNGATAHDAFVATTRALAAYAVLRKWGIDK